MNQKCCEKCRPSENALPGVNEELKRIGAHGCWLDNCDCHTTPPIESWEEELRDFIDKSFKVKKPTLGNLEREIIVDFVSKKIAAAEARGRMQGGLAAYEVLHGLAMRSQSTEMLDLIEKAQVMILDAASKGE